MLNVSELKQAIDQRDASAIAKCIKEYNLVLDGNKITASAADIKNFYEYWDKRQLVKKINLNGALTLSALV